MLEQIQKYCEELTKEFHSISEERKSILDNITDYIKSCRKSKKQIELMFICTHNSRRSHFGQVWAAVASEYYKISNVNTYSGGTETTAFHPNAIGALIRAGFLISEHQSGKNPMYAVYYAESADPLYCYSKNFDDKDNPEKEFAAILTCSDAGEKCPVVSGADIRIELPYKDPKEFDQTVHHKEKYDSCCRQIATEMLYIFSEL